MKIAKHKWMRLEAEGEIFCHIIPETDIKPHGTKVTEEKYELGTVCSCNPKIEFYNTKGEQYIKPIIIHNSFEQEKYLDEVINLK